MGTEVSDRLTAAVTIGLTKTEAAVWLAAEAFRLNPSLYPGAVFECLLEAQAELRAEFVETAREVAATSVVLMSNCDEVGQREIGRIVVPR